MLYCYGCSLKLSVYTTTTNTTHTVYKQIGSNTTSFDSRLNYYVCFGNTVQQETTLDKPNLFQDIYLN